MRAITELRRALFVMLLGSLVGCFAVGFRESALGVTELLTGGSGPIGALRSLAPWQRMLLTGGTVIAAWFVARAAIRRGKGRLGLSRLASSARGDGQPPSLPVTLLHSGATWLVTVGALSIGRESAIIETGGAIGACAVRNDEQRRPSMIAAGVAAAFAAAYHAPFSAVAYVEEHIGIRSSPRSLAYAVLGAASGVATVAVLFDGAAVLPGLERLDGRVVGLAAIGVLPAIAASLAFRVARERFPKPEAPRFGPVQWIAAAVAIGAVVVVPNVSGNGLEALRLAADHPTVQLALTLMLLKLVATTSLLHAGVPGGVFSPSLAVGAGAALATLFALGWSADDATSLWGAAIAAMAAAITISLRSPLLGALVVVELCGDPKLLPLTIGAALIAALVDHSVSLLRGRFTRSDLLAKVPVSDADG